MSIQSPFKRTVRPFRVGDYVPSNGQMSYVRTTSYSTDARPYIRGFVRLQREVRNLFEFIHPSDGNLNTHSEHVGVLLARACFEVETNLTAILRENSYAKGGNWTMEDYKKIEGSHKLSSYEVQLPEWHGTQSVRMPFRTWSAANGGLDWYKAYNKFKHDRVSNIEQATFGNLIEAWCGLFVLLSSQYFRDEFGDERVTVGFADILNPGEFWHGIGGYLKVKFPISWQDSDKYDFQLTSANFSDPNFATSFSY
jgi:hypothetical protein